jgi:N-acetyl-anhydromuramyl-L-alanine amidase AmpD
MTSSIQYKLRSGEHLNAVALYFGFGSLDPITTHPDNQALISQRGGVDRLRAGDVVTIPEGKSGKKDLAPGRGHILTVKRIPGTFILVVEVGFRLADPAAPGDISRTAARWKAFSGPLKVGGAVAKLAQEGGGPMYTLTTDGKGRCAAPLLPDGKWTVELEPAPAERSAGPATANPVGGHWLEVGSTAAKPSPANKFYEAEYQPLKVGLEVTDGAVVTATVMSPVPKDRPSPAVVFWKGLGEREARQLLHVDWRPDFLRRIEPKLRPMQYKRKAAIDLIMVHQTAGTSIGSALNTFLPPKKDSGAHFLNDLDGHLVRLADDDCFTQHGGGYKDVRVASFDGGNVNHRAIGIENVHADDTSHLDPAKNPFTDAQYKTLVGLIKDLRDVYAVPLRNVIGHQDATPKARCPGPHFEWPRLEEEGAALAPCTLDDGELETMFGGYFAGKEGRDRNLVFGDEEQGTAPDFRVVRKGKVLAERLRQRPIECIHRALYVIGYDPQAEIIQGGKRIRHGMGVFGVALAFCLSQFVRHFASGSRIRSDQSKAYLEIALGKSGKFNKVELDLELAALLRGAELAALAYPRREGRLIEVDQ